MTNEATILDYLKAFGIPEVKAFGEYKNYIILIMELLGPSLENLFHLKNRKFSLKTVCILGLQMLDRIEYVHSRKIIHRDIKPDNFCIGKGNNAHILYILDFGLSKKYWSSTVKCHIPFMKGKKLTGTPRYASINAMSGYEQSRRDDLESIGYIIMYFLRGRLPWQGLKANILENKIEKILDKKKEISTAFLCKDFPEEFELFINYIKNLDFTEVPDYEYLKNLLIKVMNKFRFEIDFCYDWCKVKPDIKRDNIIFTNDYGIEYNGKFQWLLNNDVSMNVTEENESTNEDIKYLHKGINKIKEKERYFSNTYSKPFYSVHNRFSIKNQKTINSIHIKLHKIFNDTNND